MTHASISRTRLLLWRQACELWGFGIQPPLTRALLALLPLGQIAFRASRQTRVGGEPLTATLSVIETWAAGPDPLGDHRVEQEGCHLVVLSWHLQLAANAGAEGAERLDVTPGTGRNASENPPASVRVAQRDPRSGRAASARCLAPRPRSSARRDAVRIGFEGSRVTGISGRCGRPRGTLGS